MIWLITLILLAVFAWLLLNGLNEKQWVDAHMHDEKVAADKGLLASFTALSEGDADDKVGNVVANVKKKSAEASTKIGEKITEARQSDTAGKVREKISEARQSDAAGKIREKTSGMRERIQSEVKNEDGLVNKIKTNVANGVEKVGKQVDEKIINKSGTPKP